MVTHIADHAVIYLGLLGLLIGSFLNVVIYRLPKMMERQWAAECADICGHAAPEMPTFNLVVPRSACPHCGHQIAWYENIPVLSYLFLRGKCSACAAAISMRYPLIEIVTGLLFAIAGANFGATWLGLAWCAFCAVLVALFWIDFDTQLLPDDLNFPLMWLGILVSALGMGVGLDSAVFGAIGGYMALWTVFQVHYRLTGKVGMGHGDFKLLAVLGAWFGAQYLVAIVLTASLVGAFAGLSLLVFRRIANKDIPIAFGPFLAGAGLILFALGPTNVARWAPIAFPFGPH